MTPLRIAILVPGRLHAFDLAAALQKQGHEVFVYSNYPLSEGLKFGLNPKTYRSNVLNRVFIRLWLTFLGHSRFQSVRDRIVCNWMDLWALRKIKQDLPFDVIHAFSGVALHCLRYAQKNGIYTQLLRGSAHIETQTALLVSEANRSGGSVDVPSRWMRRREQQEYEIADKIVVLSQFAARSFVSRPGSPFAEKLDLVPLGTDIQMFEPAPGVREKRIQRILSGQKLRVLLVGGLSAQKGAADFIQVAATLAEEMEFSFVGSAETYWQERCKKDAPNVRFVDRVPQQELPAIYAQYDIFYFPTVQDGFAVVIAQALASGLCVLASENSAAPDLIENAVNGYIVPAQQAETTIQLLRELDSQREALSKLVVAANDLVKARTWDDVANDFSGNVYRNKGERT